MNQQILIENLSSMPSVDSPDFDYSDNNSLQLLQKSIGIIVTGLAREQNIGNYSINPEQSLLDNLPRYNLSSKQQSELWQMISLGRQAKTTIDQHQQSGSTLVETEQSILQDMYEVGINAKQIMIESNLRLVTMIYNRKYHRYDDVLERDDIIHQGVIGLNRAVEKFDQEKGFKFSTYATWWIKKYINDFIANQSSIITVSPVDKRHIQLVKEIQQELIDKQQSSTIEAIQEATGFSANNIKFYMSSRQALRPILSLDISLSDDSATLYEIYSDPSAQAEFDNPDNNQRNLWLNQYLRDTLDDEELDIIKRNFGIGGKQPESINQISINDNVLYGHVREKRSSALQKIRARFVQDGINSEILS